MVSKMFMSVVARLFLLLEFLFLLTDPGDLNLESRVSPRPFEVFAARHAEQSQRRHSARRRGTGGRVCVCLRVQLWTCLQEKQVHDRVSLLECGGAPVGVLAVYKREDDARGQLCFWYSKIAGTVSVRPY